MLVLSREPGERIMIAGGEIIVEIVEVRGDKVRVGITAPRDIPVHREEVHEEIEHESKVRAQQGVSSQAEKPTDPASI